MSMHISSMTGEETMIAMIAPTTSIKRLTIALNVLIMEEKSLQADWERIFRFVKSSLEQ